MLMNSTEKVIGKEYLYLKTRKKQLEKYFLFIFMVIYRMQKN